MRSLLASARDPHVVAGIAIGIVAGACVNVTDYRCAEQADCRRGGAEGVCQAVGYCSYPDDVCESKQRYSDLAGPYAGDCVDLSGSSSSSDDGPDDDSTGDSDEGDGNESTTEDPERNPVGPFCGDGNLDPGEQCDDANQLDNDACNADCTEAGLVSWWTDFPFEGASKEFLGVDALGLDGLAVVGREGPSAYVGLHSTSDGAEVWSDKTDIPGGTDLATGLVTVDGRMYVSVQVGGSPTRPGMYCYEIDGSDCGQVVVDTPTSLRSASGITYIDRADAPALLLAARTGSRGAAIEIDPSVPEVVWTVDMEPPVEGVADRLRGATAIGETGYVAGMVGARMWLGTAEARGLTEVWTEIEQALSLSEAQGLVSDDTSLYVVGYIDGTEQAQPVRRVMVTRLSPQGEELWLAVVDAQGEAEALAVGADGSVFAGGFAVAPAAVPWIGKWGPDGEELWQRTYPEYSIDETKIRGIKILLSGDLVIVGESGGPSARDAFIARIRD